MLIILTKFVFPRNMWPFYVYLSNCHADSNYAIIYFTIYLFKIEWFPMDMFNPGFSLIVTDYGETVRLLNSINIRHFCLFIPKRINK